MHGSQSLQTPRLKPEGKQMTQKELHIGNSMAVMEQQLWRTGRKEASHSEVGVVIIGDATFSSPNFPGGCTSQINK